MNPLQTLANWAKTAFNAITGVLANPLDALAGLWHYITSVFNTLAWLTGVPELQALLSTLYTLATINRTLYEISQAFRRLPGWIWLTLILPVANLLQAEINANMARTLTLLGSLRATVFELHALALAYTRKFFAIEREQRIKADAAEHAAMIAAVTAALATVQKQAATGYNSGLHDRLGVIGKLITDLAEDNPAVKAFTKDLVNAVIDLETVDNPIVRAAIALGLRELIGKLGVDTVIGTLVSRLLDVVTGQARAKGLQDVTHDVSLRLNALEQQWSDFFANGGSDVEQAGREWHNLGTLLVDAGILAVFGLAVAEPKAWATTMADTVGIVGNDTLDAVFGLISRV